MNIFGVYSEGLQSKTITPEDILTTLVHPNLFQLADRFISGYAGGQWIKDEVAGIPVFYPPSDTGAVSISNTENWFEGTVSVQCCGRALCCMAYNHLLWEAHSLDVAEPLLELLEKAWDTLRVSAHSLGKEATEFYRIID